MIIIINKNISIICNKVRIKKNNRIFKKILIILKIINNNLININYKNN